MYEYCTIVPLDEIGAVALQLRSDSVFFCGRHAEQVVAVDGQLVAVESDLAARIGAAARHLEELPVRAFVCLDDKLLQRAAAVVARRRPTQSELRPLAAAGGLHLQRAAWRRGHICAERALVLSTGPVRD